ERAGERWLPLALYGEGALLAVAAMLALGLPAESPHLSPHRFVVIGAVSAIMGARNVTIIRAGAPSRDLPTTVVTRALAGAFISGPVETRLRRLATVLGMVAGAGLGALLLRFHPIFPLLLASVAVVGAAALCERESGRTCPPRRTRPTAVQGARKIGCPAPRAPTRLPRDLEERARRGGNTAMGHVEVA